MAGSTTGLIYRVTTWGESHGEAVGAVIDGCPAGLNLAPNDIQAFLKRRAPGRSRFSTARSEHDECSIQSGVFEGKTTGTPIEVLVKNTDQRSHDYSEIASYYRPGHADYTYDKKYGFRDYRGGGRSSGRETIGRVAGGAVASLILKELGISVHAFTSSIGPIHFDPSGFDISECENNPFCMPDKTSAVLAENYMNELMEKKDSAGGVITCFANGLPAGLGEPVFDKLDAEISKAVMSIGAVKGIEFGAGFAAAMMKGSEDNDAFYIQRTENGSKKIMKKTNHSGGVLGGISDGSSLVFNAAIKPTPSIGALQHTANREGENTEIKIKGRHDPVIVPRAVVVVECMTAMTIADMLLRNMSCRMDYLEKVYN